MTTIFRSMLALWTCIVTIILVPTPASAQAASEPSAALSRRLAMGSAVFPASSSELRQSLEREADRAAKASLAAMDLQPQQPRQQRSWAGRHPVALGAMMGAAGGAIWGAAECQTACEGGSLTTPIMALGAGVGAAIGAGIGAIISLVRH
jgi:hypothetical protein